jgi:hypothetical protein
VGPPKYDKAACNVAPIQEIDRTCLHAKKAGYKTPILNEEDPSQAT